MGNNWVVYADGNNNGVIEPTEILEENNYYPFELKHQGYNDMTGNTASNYKYQYNGKELQEEMGLNLYDFGARNYDPALGRWMNIDPLAENSRRWTPYNYAYNNPIYFIDPDGMQSWSFSGQAAVNFAKDLQILLALDGIDTDYTFNRKTGEIKQHGEKNNNPDRIVNLNKKGEVKGVLVDNIVKGILKDGINFKQNNNVIEINGTDQPTESQFQNFIADYTKLAGVEVSGYALGNNAMGKDISGFLVEAHKSNTSTTSNSARYNENEKIDWQYLKSSKPYLGRSRYAKYHYHSHPDNSLASDDDKLNFKGKSIPHFIISKKYNQQYNDVNVFEAKSR